MNAEQTVRIDVTRHDIEHAGLAACQSATARAVCRIYGFPIPVTAEEAIIARVYAWRCHLQIDGRIYKLPTEADTGELEISLQGKEKARPFAFSLDTSKFQTVDEWHASFGGAKETRRIAADVRRNK